VIGISIVDDLGHHIVADHNVDGFQIQMHDIDVDQMSQAVDDVDQKIDLAEQ
jgi:hypothetical protein